MERLESLWGRVQGRWLLSIPPLFVGVGGALLTYLYPDQTRAFVRDTLGISDITAAEVVFFLVILGVVIPVGLFLYINLRTYFRTHPSWPQRLRVTTRIAGFGVGAALFFWAGLNVAIVALLLLDYYVLSPLGLVLLVACSFSMVCSAVFAAAIMQGRVFGAFRYWFGILSTGGTYYVIVGYALYSDLLKLGL